MSADTHDIREGATQAACLALGKAIDALYEAEAQVRIGRSVDIVRAYARQTAHAARIITRRARQEASHHVPPAGAPTPPARRLPLS